MISEIALWLARSVSGLKHFGDKICSQVWVNRSPRLWSCAHVFWIKDNRNSVFWKHLCKRIWNNEEMDAVQHLLLSKVKRGWAELPGCATCTVYGWLQGQIAKRKGRDDFQYPLSSWMRELQMIFKEMLLKQLSCNVHFSFLGLFFFFLFHWEFLATNRHQDTRIITSADLGPFLPEEAVVAKNW